MIPVFCLFEQSIPLAVYRAHEPLAGVDNTVPVVVRAHTRGDVALIRNSIQVAVEARTVGDVQVVFNAIAIAIRARVVTDPSDEVVGAPVHNEEVRDEVVV